MVLQNELGNGLKKVLEKKHLIILFLDNAIYRNLNEISSKVIDVGFSPQNTVNITHLVLESNSKITLNLFFQRTVEDIEGNLVVEKEVKEESMYCTSMEPDLLYVYPLIATLKVLFQLI